MKPTSLIPSAFMLTLLNASLAYGQDDKDKIAIASPFAKGNTFWNMSNELKFSWKNLESNGESEGNRNRFGLKLEGTYFMVDHFGVGIGISSHRTRTKNGDIEQLEVSTMGSVNAMYGRTIGESFNIYGRGEFSVGLDKSKYESPGYSQDDKYNEYGVNFEVGAPLTLGKSTGFYLTPFINYDYSVSKDDSYKDVSSGIKLGTRLNISLPCAAYAHDCDQINEFSENMYSKGTNVIGGSTSLALQFGTQKSSYIGEDMYDEYENSLSDMCASAEIDYFHYLIDNVAFGAELRLRGSGEKDKETDYKQSDFSWMVMPAIQAHLPVEGKMNNSFAYAGYGIGTSKDKTTNTANQTTETKYNNSEINFGIGYNLFMAESLALVPLFIYSMYTRKNADSEAKDTRNGLEARFSLRHTF